MADDATEVLIEALTAARSAHQFRDESRFCSCGFPTTWVGPDYRAERERHVSKMEAAALTVPVVEEDCPTCGGTNHVEYALTGMRTGTCLAEGCTNGKVSRRALDVFADKTREAR